MIHYKLKLKMDLLYHMWLVNDLPMDMDCKHSYQIHYSFV